MDSKEKGRVRECIIPKTMPHIKTLINGRNMEKGTHNCWSDYCWRVRQVLGRSTKRTLRTPKTIIVKNKKYRSGCVQGNNTRISLGQQWTGSTLYFVGKNQGESKIEVEFYFPCFFILYISKQIYFVTLYLSKN